MDHIIENEGKPVPDLSSISESARPAPPAGDGMDVDGDDEELVALKAVYGKAGGQDGGEGSSGAAAEGAEAKSIKCSICGKTFKNVDLANFHAEKSGHDQFEESTEEVCVNVLAFWFPSVSCVSLSWCYTRRPLDLSWMLGLRSCLGRGQQCGQRHSVLRMVKKRMIGFDPWKRSPWHTTLGDWRCLEITVFFAHAITTLRAIYLVSRSFYPVEWLSDRATVRRAPTRAVRVDRHHVRFGHAAITGPFLPSKLRVQSLHLAG